MANEYKITSCQGHDLHCEEHLPAGETKAVLFWHHGLGDHVARYHYFFQKLSAEGVAVYCHDALSHGKSASELRCLINNFDAMIDDVYVHVTEIKKKYASVPLFMGGHSMGGLVAARVVLKQQDIWSGLILTSAAIDVHWTPVLRIQAAVGNVLAALLPKAQLVPAVQPEHMSQDPQVVKEYLEDPLIFHGNVRARTANEILKGMKHMAQHEAELSVPIFAVHGNADKTTCLDAVKRLVKNSASKDTTVMEVPGGYHELLMGPEKEEVIAAICTWLVRHIAPATPIAAEPEQPSAPAAAAAPVEAQATAAEEAVPAEVAGEAAAATTEAKL